MSEDRPTLYLIAHRVRGEPAFDIATPLQIGDEDGWIIPTSGHRAYPYWYIDIDELYPRELIESECMIGESVGDAMKHNRIECPPDWPDHYRVSASPRTANPTATRDLLSSLGLLKPAEPIKRRI